MNQLIRCRVLQQRVGQVRFGSTGPEAVKTRNLYRMLSIIAVPAVVCGTGYSVYLLEKEHKAHHVRPEYKEYSHMGIRNKDFPWKDGVRSLFHNPKTNPIPGVGYEE